MTTSPTQLSLAKLRHDGWQADAVNDKLLRKFLARVGQRDPVTGCIPWTGAVDGDGYGLFSIWLPDARKTHTWRATRLAWLLTKGTEVPAGLLLCHRCDNPPCINVEHLFVGTTADNLRDRDKKGRQARGERSGMSRFTNEQVRWVRAELAAKRPPCDIANDLGCSLSAVNHIRYRRVWRWL